MRHPLLDLAICRRVSSLAARVTCGLVKLKSHHAHHVVHDTALQLPGLQDEYFLTYAVSGEFEPVDGLKRIMFFTTASLFRMFLK